MTVHVVQVLDGTIVEIATNWRTVSSGGWTYKLFHLKGIRQIAQQVIATNWRTVSSGGWTCKLFHLRNPTVCTEGNYACLQRNTCAVIPVRYRIRTVPYLTIPYLSKQVQYDTKVVRYLLRPFAGVVFSWAALHSIPNSTVLVSYGTERCHRVAHMRYDSVLCSDEKTRESQWLVAARESYRSCFRQPRRKRYRTLRRHTVLLLYSTVL